MEEIFCPDCNDTRTVIALETKEECCGIPTRRGDCCNNPIAVQVQVQLRCNTCNIDLI